MNLRGKILKIANLVRRIVVASGELNLGLIAAGVAFFSMLSLFPAMAALIAIFGLFLDPSVALDQASTLKSIMPEGAYSIIADQLSALIAARSPTLGAAGLVSLGLAVWSARAGVGALMLGLNAICRVEDRGSLRHYMSSIFLTLLLLCVAGVALATVVVTPVLLAFFPAGPNAAKIIFYGRWAMALSAVLIGVGAIYRFGPNLAGNRVAWLTTGSVLVTGLWFVSSFAFSFYLSRFGNYNETYGSIGAVAALLMWFYLTAYLILVGAAWNMALRDLRLKKAA